MEIRKAYKYQLKTDAKTGQPLSRFAGCCRFVWNKALGIQKERLKNGEHCLSYPEMSKLLTGWKREEETAFLKEAPANPLQQTLMQLDRALKDAFKKDSPKRFPRFKRRGQHDAFRHPNGFKIEGNRIFLPKQGWLRFRKSREIVGTPRNITVSKRGDHWFVAIQTVQTVPTPVHPGGGVVGIDMGIARFATLSDGSTVKPLNSFKRLEKKLATAQRILARRVKFSANWKKQKRVVQRIHARIADARNDFLHKFSTRIASENQAVILEDLKVSNMSASASGTVDAPGKNVRAKSGLNRSILDQGWFEFRRQLGYKLDWLGGQILLVNPAYTSQKCSRCGHTDKESRDGLNFSCTSCRIHLDADVNAAINILAVGQTVSACGETGAGRFDEAGTGGDRLAISAPVTALSN